LIANKWLLPDVPTLRSGMPQSQALAIQDMMLLVV